MFLKVTPDFQVVATSKIEDSSDFFISSNEDGDSPYEFSIMYMAPSPLEERGIKPIARYLYAPVNSFGRNAGPLGLRLDAKDTKTKLTLHSRRVHHYLPVDTKDWINSKDIFYLNCKQRAVKKNGYICVKRAPRESGVDEDYLTCCVPTIKKHNELKDHFMLFRLIRAGKRVPGKHGAKKDEDEEDGGLGVVKRKKSSRALLDLATRESEGQAEAGGGGGDRPLVGEDTVDTVGKRRGGGKDGKGRGKGEGGKGEKKKKKQEKEGKKSGLLGEIAEEDRMAEVGDEGEEGGAANGHPPEIEQET